MISKSMFLVKTRSVTEEGISRGRTSKGETGEASEIRALVKERIIVTYLYLLLSTAGISVILYLVLTIMKSDSASKILQIALYALSSFTGYLFGANKRI
jgi:hypothetical protein